MDALDIKAISILMAKGRATWAELAQSMELSAPAVAERVRRLEERGVIRGYTAVIDPVSAGCSLTAFVFVSLSGAGSKARFLAAIDEMDEVLECHHVAGEYDYLLKVRCAGTPELETIISERLKGVSGVAKTYTTIALSTAKETIRVPFRQQIEN